MTRSDIILEKGLSAQCTAVADETNSAARMGSGDLPVFATAVLTAVEGRKLTFNVGARDEEGMIGEGVHVRFVVDREKFMAKVAPRG